MPDPLCKWFTPFDGYSRSLPSWVPWGQKPSLINFLNIPVVSTPGVHGRKVTNVAFVGRQAERARATWRGQKGFPPLMLVK